MSTTSSRSLFDRAILGPAAVDSVRKLDPRVQARNPVMFVVFTGSALTTSWRKNAGLSFVF